MLKSDEMINEMNLIKLGFICKESQPSTNFYVATSMCTMCINKIETCSESKEKLVVY